MKRWQCRLARVEDADALVQLQVHCAWEMGLEFYSAFELESYFGEIGTLDGTLIHDRTYYVVEDGSRLVGCGGWSDRPPHYDSQLSHAGSPERLARIRGFFVHPDYARQGIGRALMSQVEADIRRAGHKSVELTAMLSGVTFYRSLAYRKTANSVVELSNGAALPAIEMIKHFDEAARMVANRNRPTRS